ncbi:unnamed protein product [Polarella glacialis]|uniref:Calcineurin-like phosphoesterase domain-containing protein n=1 Tax=Polarella glacialis TaxID=89957 RepID=A0A813GSL9_POLGL|nr:unnamed protein product [Polarella glacialis]
MQSRGEERTMASLAPCRRPCLLLALLVAFASCERIVSIADLHGDYERALEILVAAQLVDRATLSWIGGNTTLVQTGDIVDRGDYGKRIYELFFKLKEEAVLVGGSVINLLGNHEVMNIQGDLRYVSTGDTEEFGGSEARARAWAADGWLGEKIRGFYTAVQRGGVLFVHAGLEPSILDGSQSLEGLNDNMALAVASDASPKLRALAAPLGDSGPVWTRLFASGSEEACAAAKETLRLTGAVRMVVGHTIQHSVEGFRVNPVCWGSVVLADTAISRACGGAMSFIEHDGLGGAVVVYPGSDDARRQKLPLPPSSHSESAALKVLKELGEAPTRGDRQPLLIWTLAILTGIAILMAVLLRHCRGTKARQT